MQTDTLIGIVGAAVLVAVMVGVFAYEYNNTPEDDGNGGGGDGDDPARMEAFREAYPTLNATEDIDEDGVPNWQEDNLTLHVVKDIDGAVAARSSPTENPSDTSNTFRVYTGFTSGTVTVTWDTTAAPGTGTVVDNLSVSISGLGACSNGDGTATCDLAGAEPGEEYTITVQHAGPPAGAQPKSFEGTVELHYG